MDQMRLGKTEIMASRYGFGALPIQRVSREEAALLLRKAFDHGVNFFDTARAYTDSEEKMGYALSDVRSHIYIATKTHAKDKKTLFEHLELSLKKLQTDYIDVYQLHNPAALDYENPDGVLAGLAEAKRKGLVRFIGLTSHRLSLAMKAAASGRIDTIQFPLSMLSSSEDIGLTEECRKYDVGLIAMKAMSGGLIRHPEAAFAFLRQYANVLPIWGVQREEELDEFLGYEKNPPALDDRMKQLIEDERRELSGDFCRGCGYCQPCAAGIPIETAARLTLLMSRAPYEQFLTDDFREQMDRIENCTGCGHCRSHCPYGLDTPALLRRNLEDYRAFRMKHGC
ncbi:MAG TPA: aldo/keto reductase [Clostridia bacterium]|nr:aldo/keto reductase [Clostridia bacterium]